MYSLKGFFEYAVLIDNTYKSVSKFGELSANSRTYAKDKQTYSSNDHPGVSLVSFHSVEDNDPTVIPTPVLTNVMNIGRFIIDKAMDGIITSNGGAFVQLLNAEFSGYIENLTVGNLQTDDVIWMPEWISFNDPNVSGGGAITLWFSDASFANQYPEYRIEVIPPMEQLDDFFRDPLEVRSMLETFNFTEVMEDIQAIRGDYPYTLLKGMRYDYRDPQDSSFQVPSYWNVIIYGQAGNNPDVIKQAIIDYVLERSNYTQEQWAEILPDLFITTEFIFTPMWDNYSVPNLNLHAGIYSPTVKPGVVIDYALAHTKGPMYTASHIENNVEFTAHIYKSLAMAVVGNPDNRDGLISFYEMFPDYMLVTNNSPDYNRVSVRTQEFMARLNQLIQIAESFTGNSPVPPGYARVTREGVLYITTNYENVTYLVVAKSSLVSQGGSGGNIYV